MTDIVKYLFKTFALLRDLVGYLIPGLVFLALLDPHGAWAFANTSPGWILAAAVLLASYAAAQLLAAAGYALLNLFHPEGSAADRETSAASRKDRFYYSTYYPDIFIEANRQDTIHLMRIAMSVALVLAGTLQLFLSLYAWFRGHLMGSEFLLPFLSWTACLIAGVLLFLNARSGDAHIRETAQAALEAAKMAEAKGRQPAP